MTNLLPSAPASRHAYLDSLRVFAVFTMILLHVAATTQWRTPIQSLDWQAANVYNTFVRCCVPIFVMISGFLFLNFKKKITIKKLYAKYILRIFTAFLFWTFIYALYSLFIDPANLSSQQFFNEIIHGPPHLWFLFMIAGLYVVTPFLRKIIENKSLTHYFLILGCIVTLLLPFLMEFTSGWSMHLLQNIRRMDIFIPMGFAFYFVLGHYLGTYNIITRYRFVIYFLALLSIVFTVLMTYHLSVMNNQTKETFYYNLLPNTCLVAAAVFLLFKNIKPKISPNVYEKLTKCTSFISAHCFGIYLVHILIIYLMTKYELFITSNALLLIPFNTIVIFLISFLIIFIILRIPFVRKYIV